MRWMLVAVLAAGSCGEDGGASRCSGSANLSARDGCYCVNVSACKRVAQCGGGGTSCVESSFTRCDLRPDDKTFGPAAFSQCLGVIAAMPCEDAANEVLLNATWNRCILTGATVACHTTCQPGNKTCGDVCIPTAAMCSLPPGTACDA